MAAWAQPRPKTASPNLTWARKKWPDPATLWFSKVVNDHPKYLMPCGKSGAFYHLLNNDFPNNKKTLSQMTILHEIFNQIYLVKQRKNFFFAYLNVNLLDVSVPAISHRLITSGIGSFSRQFVKPVINVMVTPQTIFLLQQSLPAALPCWT